ncbi:MAG: Fe-S cluster assembly protein SufD [Gemmatales bacterium]
MSLVAPSPEARARLSQLLQFHGTLEQETSNTDAPLLRRIRTAALGRIEDEGFPAPKDEEWRFTSLNGFYTSQFSLPQHAPLKKSQLTPVLSLPGTHRLICYQGIWQHALSSATELPRGCSILSLNDALKTIPDKVEAWLDRQAHQQGNIFAALNSAFLQDALVIHLGHECVVEQPIHLAMVEAGAGYYAFPRILFIAERHSQATIIESYQSLGDAADCTCAVTEFVMADEAQLDHYRFNDVNRTSCHFASQHLKSKRGTHFRSHAFTLGGGLVRNDLYAHLGAENSETTFNGLYTADGTRLVDNHTTIDHAMPHCNSHEIYKGIIGDKGKGVFNGKIFVRQDAQKTDAKQTNQTVLLSADATIDTKPQLEIFADDVKCTHGATVGQLDDEMLFYLRSRGISKTEAQSILVYAFANDIISRVHVEPLKDVLEHRFLQAEPLE